MRGVWPPSKTHPDPDVPLALGPLIESVYERSRYARRIDYAKPLDPPLPPEEAAWLRGRLPVTSRVCPGVSRASFCRACRRSSSSLLLEMMVGRQRVSPAALSPRPLCWERDSYCVVWRCRLARIRLRGHQAWHHPVVFVVERIQGCGQANGTGPDQRVQQAQALGKVVGYEIG
jgi:hypothetical protein